MAQTESGTNISEPARAAGRAFDFYRDTFSYPNELVWEYHFDSETGRATTHTRNPPPTYSHHCFVVARSARQFFLHAAFRESSAPVGDEQYGALIRSVVARSDWRPSMAGERIEIAGFADLRQFSAARTVLLRENCGGAWQSYVQRGNWRMVMPFTRAGQEVMADGLGKALREGRLPIAHVVTFPKLTINHAVLVFGAAASGAAIEFQCYDPNIVENPLVLVYDRAARTFVFPRTHYFPGGPVNAYEIYRGLLL